MFTILISVVIKWLDIDRDVVVFFLPITILIDLVFCWNSMVIILGGIFNAS